jgi:hypothetical protein
MLLHLGGEYPSLSWDYLGYIDVLNFDISMIIEGIMNPSRTGVRMIEDLLNRDPLLHVEQISELGNIDTGCLGPWLV